MADRIYRTIDGDEMDYISYREYGISSRTTEKLLDENYRIADLPIKMPSGVNVTLPPQTVVALSQLIKLWE